MAALVPWTTREALGWGARACRIRGGGHQCSRGLAAGAQLDRGDGGMARDRDGPVDLHLRPTLGALPTSDAAPTLQSSRSSVGLLVWSPYQRPAATTNHPITKRIKTSVSTSPLGATGMLCRAISSQRAVDTYHAPCVSALRRGRSERRRDSCIREPRNHTRGRS